MLRDKKITQAEMDENNVKSVPGKKLTGDAQSNKNVFDKLVEFLAGKYNRMVDELVSPDGASQIGVRPVLEITGENAQAVFEFMASLIKTNNLNAVHKMGAEEISGIKTFLDQISVGNGVTKGVLKFEQDYVVLESSRSGRISRLELGQFQDTALNLYFTNWDGNRYKIWHGGNDGSGSGLDADTVDGKHVDNQSTTAGLWTAEKLISELEQKVDKVAGMGLSQSSFLHTEKAKLAGMEDGANRYILPPGSVHTLGGFKVGENLYADPDGTLHSMGGGGGSGGSLFFIQREVFVTGEGQVESIVIPYIENFKTNAPEVLLQNGNAWENAFEGMHYTFRFVSTVSLEITFYQVGTYKVNYGYASISHMLAEHVDYISEESGLSAANIQDAMDEVKGVLDHTKVALSEEVSARQLLDQNVQASMAPINSPVFTGTPKIGANVIATTNQIPTSFAASAVTVSEAVRSLYGLGVGASVDGALASGKVPAVLTFRSSQTWTVPTNVRSVDVYICNGGGGGGTGNCGGNNYGGIGGNGGHGGVSRTIYSYKVIPNSSIQVIIGSGGISQYLTDSIGGVTSFGEIRTGPLTKGQGGIANIVLGGQSGDNRAANAEGSKGKPGVYSDGNGILPTVLNGSSSYVTSLSSFVYNISNLCPFDGIVYGSSGGGGASASRSGSYQLSGSGGTAGNQNAGGIGGTQTIPGNNTGQPGQSATHPGCGGGGGGGSPENSDAYVLGGNGAPGICVIRYYP